MSIYPRAGEVTGPGGREKLDPKVMDVLVMLARHAPQVVLRDDLLATLWPHAVVTDEAPKKPGRPSGFTEKTEQLTTKIPGSTLRKIRLLSAETKVPIGAFITEGLEAVFAAHPERHRIERMIEASDAAPPRKKPGK